MCGGCLALAPHKVPASFPITLFLLFSFAALCDGCSLYERVQYTKIHWVRVVLQTLTIHVNIQFTVLCTCCSAGGKHPSQSWTCWVSDATADSIRQDRLSECTLNLRESFHLEGTAKVIGIDKPAATRDRMVIGI